jgi:hypothetical protein
VTDALATRPTNGAAGQLAPAPAPLDTFRPLDTFAGGLADEAPRLDALATISAGDRGPAREDNKPGLPRRSMDGTIKLHDATGRAPGLRAALERTQYTALTVAFPWDDPALFIQQRFVRYSTSALEVYGDHRELRVLDGQTQRTVAAGSEEYRRLLDTCAVSVSVYFMLAEWEPQPAVVLPDGLGFYRLRFTSRNSLRSILNGLRALGRFTGGRVAGVPFELRIDYRETTDRTQKRRTIPVWVLVMRPPSTVKLASHNWAGVVRGALRRGRRSRSCRRRARRRWRSPSGKGPRPTWTSRRSSPRPAMPRSRESPRAAPATRPTGRSAGAPWWTARASTTPRSGASSCCTSPAAATPASRSSWRWPPRATRRR